MGATDGPEEFPVQDLPRPGEPDERYVGPAEADQRNRDLWGLLGWIWVVGALLLLWAWDELAR